MPMLRVDAKQYPNPTLTVFETYAALESLESLLLNKKTEFFLTEEYRSGRV